MNRRPEQIICSLASMLACLLILSACSAQTEPDAEPMPTASTSVTSAATTSTAQSTTAAEADYVATVMAEMAKAPPEFYADPNAPAPQWVQVLTTTVPLPDTALVPVDTSDAGRSVGFAFALLATPAGDIWVGDDFEIEMPVVAFAHSSAGELLGTGCAGIQRFTDMGWEPIVDSLNQDPEKPVMAWCSSAIATTDNGDIWITQVDFPQGNGHGVIQYNDAYAIWHGKSFEIASRPQFDIIAWPFSDTWVMDMSTWIDGNLLITIDEHVVTFRNNEWWLMENYPWETFAHLLSLTVGPDKAIWAGTAAGFIRYDGQSWSHFNLGNSAEGPIAVGSIAPAADGSAWMITSAGLAHYQNEHAFLYPYPEGLEISIFATKIVLDQANNLWLSSSYGGLWKLETAAVPSAQLP
jgi:hypothetical protein